MKLVKKVELSEFNGIPTNGVVGYLSKNCQLFILKIIDRKECKIS